MASAEHALKEMGDVGERTLQDGFGEVVAGEIFSATKLICALEVGWAVAQQIHSGLLSL